MSFTPEERPACCRQEDVRARAREFFGLAAHGDPRAIYLAVGTARGSRHRAVLPVEELPSWLDRGVELNRSKYERDHGWGEQWRGVDPGTRADFYARVFTSLLVAGVDGLVDFNGQSARGGGQLFGRAMRRQPATRARFTTRKEKP